MRRKAAHKNTVFVSNMQSICDTVAIAGEWLLVHGIPDMIRLQDTAGVQIVCN